MADAATSVFVDRETELALLQNAFAEAAQGDPRVVVIAGEAGIGKTTLLERFLWDLTGGRVLRADGDESESHVAFAVADQLLRVAGGTSDALRSGQHVGVGLELLELIGRGPEGSTCVVIVDDAHLADAESLRALLFAARRIGGMRALVLLAVRGDAHEALPEGWLKLTATPGGGLLDLGPLPAAHISELGSALGVAMTPGAAQRLWEHTQGNPLHARAVIRELPDDEHWQHEHRPLPVPASYALLIRRRLERCEPEVVGFVEAAAVLGVRAPLHAVAELGALANPLAALDDAVGSGLVRLDDRRGRAVVEFAHPLVRAAIYDAVPNARRSALNTAAAAIVDDPAAAMRHRVEAAAVTDAALVAELESHAHAEMIRGAWLSAVASLLAAGRLSPSTDDRERLELAAIEAMMYSGDGAAARRLAERTDFRDGPRRDSVLAYLAMFAGDLEVAQRLLMRAWKRRSLAGDDRLSATIAQRSAFLATSRLRGRDAIAWVERAVQLAPEGDPETGLLVAPSLALGMSFTGRRREAHAALDRWLDSPSAPLDRSGFVLRALKGYLLLADGELSAARAAFETSAREGLEQGLFVVAALSLSGLTRVEYFAGAWDAAVVSAERAIALAVESEDSWMIGQAHWSASLVPAARGEWPQAEAHVHEISRRAPTFERHIAAEAIAAAGLAAAQERPAEVQLALEPFERMYGADGATDPAFLPWQHLKAHALVDTGDLEGAEPFITAGAELAAARANPLLAARMAHARARLAFVRGELERAVGSLQDAHATVEPLGMPYEQALIEVGQGQILRRAGERRAAAAALAAAHNRLASLEARPALRRCETELAACGLAPSARKFRDYSAFTPQERAVTRLVVSGMTNREVAAELMLSTKTVEFHLSNIYTKIGVRSRSELRARARANELAL